MPTASLHANKFGGFVSFLSRDLYVSLPVSVLRKKQLSASFRRFQIRTEKRGSRVAGFHPFRNIKTRAHASPIPFCVYRKLLGRLGKFKRYHCFAI
jgi:hypothetical protein